MFKKKLNGINSKILEERKLVQNFFCLYINTKQLIPTSYVHTMGNYTK